MFPIIDKRKTGVNLRRIMDKRGITPKDVQEYLKLNCVQSVYRWLDGRNMPTIDNLYALSQLLQVPIDKIVRGNMDDESAEDNNSQSLNFKEKRWSTCSEKLNEKNVA